jgi:hypothetical protein
MAFRGLSHARTGGMKDPKQLSDGEEGLRRILVLGSFSLHAARLSIP